MNPIVFKTIAGKTRYLSTSGKWIVTKVQARTYGSMEEAQAVAKQHAAGVTTYRFRNF